MSVNRVYHTWFERIRQLRPKERITRLRNFAWIAAGVLGSRSVHLSRIAEKIPGRAKAVSKTSRVRRFLSNRAIRVREWYEPVARDLLQHVVAQGLEVRLLTDGTKIGFGHQLLMVSLAYRRRAIPIAWTWVNSAVLKQLEQWHWGYVMRQKGDTRVLLSGQQVWLRFDSLVQKGARPQWLPDAQLTQKHGYTVHLVVWWKAGEKEPWLLATNLLTSRDALRTYKRRMWIEEMFGDFKKHGFDLESSHLRHFLRLSRLTLIVAFLYVWLIAFGSQVIKHGLRHLVDRADRMDLSVFRIGLRMLERCLANDESFSLCLVPYFY